MLIKDSAICIRAVDYSETSQVVTFFARESGKISAIAKGSKRPKSAFDGPIEILSHGKIIFAESGREKLATLTEFDPIHDSPDYVGPRSDFFVLNCCFFAAELLNHFTHDYDPHPDLFDSFLHYLQNAERHETKHHMLAALILFQLGLLKEIGLQPILSSCVNCKTTYARGEGILPLYVSRASRPRIAGRMPATHKAGTASPLYFSSSANGLICRDCEASFPDKIRLSKNAAACLTSLKRIPEASEKILREIEKIFVHHFTELLGRPPKMAKHILHG